MANAAMPFSCPNKLAAIEHAMGCIGCFVIITKLNACVQDNANSSSRMDIYIVNVQIGMHGSDTGAYDPQGR
jgi:hypothetical protein